MDTEPLFQTVPETPDRVEGEVVVDDTTTTTKDTETPKRVEGAHGSGDGGHQAFLTPVDIFEKINDDDESLAEPATKKQILDPEEEFDLDLDLPKVPREEDKGKWKLPAKLADHFKETTKQHITDKDIASYMKDYPTPTNIDCVPRLDESARRSLRDKNLTPTIDNDDDFVQIQRKIQDIMDPLGAAWGQLMLWKAGRLIMNEDAEKALIDQVDKAVILTGHAIHKVSWHRRIGVLSAIGKNNGAKNADIKNLLKQERIQEIFLNDTSGELFGKQFDEATKSENSSRSNFAALFQQKKKETKKTTTATSSSAATSGIRKRPFSSNPLPRGGGYHSQHQRERDDYSPNPFRRGQQGENRFQFNKRGGGYNKGNFVETTLCQHALKSNMAPIIRPRAPNDKGCFSSNGSDFAVGRENTKVLSQLENSNQRQSYFGYTQSALTILGMF